MVILPRDREKSSDLFSLFHLGSDDFDFESVPPTRRSSQTRFTTNNRPKWNNNWPFETDDDGKSTTTTTATNDSKFPSMFQQRSTIDNPFMMFEMLSRAMFDKFFNDDLFWQHFDLSDPLNTNNSQNIHFPNLNSRQTSRANSSRLRSASQQRPTNRTRIHVNHVPSSSNKPTNEMHFEWLGHHPRQKRTTSTSRFDSKDSDEENLEETYVYQQSKPTTINGHRLRRRMMNNNNNNSHHEPKTAACQFCFQPLTSLENRLQHEATCRHRPNKSTSSYRMKSHPPPPPTTTTTTSNDEKLFTSKCTYCQQEVRITDRLDHEALCKKFGTKRQTTGKSQSKRFNNSTSNSVHNDETIPPKSSSGNRMKQPSSDDTPTN